MRVCATAVNPVDWKIRSGGQRNIIRLKFPWILGLDVSGVVEAVGRSVTRFKVGDEVWSSPRHTRPGTYAEYVCIDEREVGKKPKSLSHDEAASLPLVALTAYQCVVEKGRVVRGQTILVHAGSGGVGAVAIQIGKHLGAHVVTTCSARNADFVRDLGAERTIDYTKESFGDSISEVDFVLDSVGESAFADNLRVLRRGGRISNITVDVTAHVTRYGAPFGRWMLAMGPPVFADMPVSGRSFLRLHPAGPSAKTADATNAMTPCLILPCSHFHSRFRLFLNHRLGRASPTSLRATKNRKSLPCVDARLHLCHTGSLGKEDTRHDFTIG